MSRPATNHRVRIWVGILIVAVFILVSAIVVFMRPIYYDGRTLQAWISLSHDSADPKLREQALSILERTLMDETEVAATRRKALDALWRIEPWRTLPFHFETLKRRPYDASGDVGYELARIWDVYEMELEGRAKAIVPYLTRSLFYVDNVSDDREFQVRKWAIHLLGKCGSDAKDAIPALENVAKYGHGHDPLLRKYAEAAIRRIEDRLAQRAQPP